MRKEFHWKIMTRIDKDDEMLEDRREIENVEMWKLGMWEKK